MARPFPRAGGAALVAVLVLTVAVLMISVSAVRVALNGALSARFERDRLVALQAARAALADAERDIAGGADPSSARASLLAGGSGFADGCGHGPADLGLCLQAAPPAWERVDLSDPAVTVPYGRFTGATMPTGSGMLPARAPRYIIEAMHLAGAGASSGAFYRITAIGFGTRPATRVVLQSWYRRPPAVPQADPDSLPAGRVSWREVPNWPELHQAATH